MKAVQLLREQLQSAHWLMEETMKDVTKKSAHFTKLKKAIPVGAAYAHAVLSEDMIVADMLAHTKQIVNNAEMAGVSKLMPSMDKWTEHEKWYQTVKVDLPKLRLYAKKVYKATDIYLATLTEKDLDTKVDVPGMGKQTLGWLISNYVISHAANLTGEISAAKGMQGLKGYQF